ncbi:MAG: PIN domain-containing protein [Thermoguttaceae bacterium]
MQSDAEQDESKPLCIVIDSSAWVSELFLRSPTGVAFIYHLRQSRIALGLPEVIEREIARNAIKQMGDWKAAIQQNSRKLFAVTGHLNVEHLPGNAQIEAASRNVTAELEGLFLRVPFTLDHARSALDRVESGLPPNHSNQQFKDSAIWEAVLELARTNRVHFVTNDGAFYKKTAEGEETVAANLRGECGRNNAAVTLYRNLSSCLKSLQQGVIAKPFDSRAVASEIEKALDPALLAGMAAESNCRFTGERISESVSAFLTGKTDELAVDFELTYRLEVAGEDEPAQAIEPAMTVRGNCFYDVATKKVSDVGVSVYQFNNIPAYTVLFKMNLPSHYPPAAGESRAVFRSLKL